MTFAGDLTNSKISLWSMKPEFPVSATGAAKASILTGNESAYLFLSLWLHPCPGGLFHGEAWPVASIRRNTSGNRA